MSDQDDAATEWEELDFVFAGRRILEKNKMGALIYPIKTNGELGAARLYGYKFFKRCAVGGVYTGAKFTDNQISGHSAARYKQQWANLEQRIEWRALDEGAETQDRQAKLEADARKISDIERIMLPLREAYASFSRRYDRAGQQALEGAVLAALRAAPRRSEKN